MKDHGKHKGHKTLQITPEALPVQLSKKGTTTDEAPKKTYWLGLRDGVRKLPYANIDVHGVLFTRAVGLAEYDQHGNVMSGSLQNGETSHGHPALRSSQDYRSDRPANRASSW